MNDMNPWSIALVLTAFLMVAIDLPFWGYTRRVNLFNYDLGRAIGRGQVVDPDKTHEKVFWICVLLTPLGGLFYLLGWWLGGNKGVDLGREVGERDLVTQQILAQNSG